MALFRRLQAEPVAVALPGAEIWISNPEPSARLRIFPAHEIAGGVYGETLSGHLGNCYPM